MRPATATLYGRAAAATSLPAASAAFIAAAQRVLCHWIHSCVAIGAGSSPTPGPGDVNTSVSVATRDGAAHASSCATMPPMEAPTTCARSMRRWSISLVE